MNAAIDPNRLYTILQKTGLRSKDSNLYDLLYNLIGNIVNLRAENSSGSTPSPGGTTINNTVNETIQQIILNEVVNENENFLTIPSNTPVSSSPTTTLGDMIYRGSSVDIRLPIGSSGQVLKSLSGIPTWDSSFAIFFFGAGAAGTGHSPADSTNYYYTTSFGFNPSTVDASAGVNVPAMTIKSIFLTTSVFGTGASTENVPFNLRLNSTTNTFIANMQFLNSAGPSGTINTASNTGLNISISAGDKIAINFTTPAWVTNPTAVFYAAVILIAFP